MAFEGDIQVINGLVPANGNDFPLVEASHVYVDDSNNLDDKLTAMDNRMDAISGDVTAKAPKASPEFTGSISMGRKSGSTTGVRNVATGDGVIGAANFSHVFGTFNEADSYDNWQEWQGGTFYDIGAKVYVTQYFPDHSIKTYYVCNTSHMSQYFDETKWDEWGNKMNYAEIVGNGLDDSNRSNARTLDWQGNEYLSGGLTLGDGSKGLRIGNTKLTETDLIALLNMLNGNS